MNFFRRLFGLPERSPHDVLRSRIDAISRNAASRARYTLAESTKTIDVSAASLDQLNAAMVDCRLCLQPSSVSGYSVTADDMIGKIEAELESRGALKPKLPPVSIPPAAAFENPQREIARNLLIERLAADRPWCDDWAGADVVDVTICNAPDGVRLWVDVDGANCFRAYRIKRFSVTDHRLDAND